MGNIYNMQIDRDTLHERLNGGLPKGSIVFIEGADGSGKSIISQRLLFGFLTNGYKATYISSELTTKGFIEQMRALNYEVLPYVVSRQLLFVPVYPLIGRPRPKSEFLKMLMSAKELFKNDIVIIDTLSGILEEGIDDKTILDVTYFFKKIASENKTIALTADPEQMNKGMLMYLRNTSDVYLQLIVNLSEAELAKMILVKRFSQASEYVGSVTGFRVEPQVGLIVDITTVA